MKKINLFKWSQTASYFLHSINPASPKIYPQTNL